MVICGSCQTQNSPKAKFCVKCGANLRPEGLPAQTQTAAKEPKQKAAAVETRRGKARAHKVNELLAEAKGEASLIPLAKEATAIPAAVKKGLSDLAVQDDPASAPANDLAPLLAQEGRFFATQADLADAETPVQLWLNFPRAMVAGYGSIIEVKVENAGNTRVQQVELMLESTGLDQKLQTLFGSMGPGHSAYMGLEITPNKAGNFVLRCTVKVVQDQQVSSFRGKIPVPITVNVVPDGANLVVNISDIQCVRGGGANTGLGQEFGSVNISNLLPAGAIRTVNDLLNITFPQSFGKVPLELDYEVSGQGITQLRSDSAVIPRQFSNHIQSGTKLVLEPLSQPANNLILPIHLVARDVFRLCRSRRDGDVLTWFWPRSPENDERTKRLSKKHVIAEIYGDQVVLRDDGSANGATFEGHPLSTDKNEILGQRGTLILAHEYYLDVSPFPSTLPKGLQISNERIWPGPPATKRSSFNWGSIRFLPTNSEIAQHNALWLFTDANFGYSKVNPVIINAGGVGEVEGRFHYYRQNFWIESLPEGNAVSVESYKLKSREIVPLANGTRIQLGDVTFRCQIEP